MTEKYTHPVDPATLQFQKAKNRYGRGFEKITAVGRGQYEGKLFVHMKNVGNLEVARAMAEELTKLYGFDVVTGPGIDMVRSCRKNWAMFTNTNIGLFKEDRRRVD